MITHKNSLILLFLEDLSNKSVCFSTEKIPTDKKRTLLYMLIPKTRNSSFYLQYFLSNFNNFYLRKSLIKRKYCGKLTINVNIINLRLDLYTITIVK